MVNYATLDEAFGIDNFNKKKKSDKKSKEKEKEKFLNDYSAQDLNYFKSNIEKFSENIPSSSCSPLETPNYNIDISENAKLKYKEAMDIFINENDNNETIKKNNDDAYKNRNKDNINKFNEFNNEFDNNNEISPYYDDDLDKYFNIDDNTSNIIKEDNKINYVSSSIVSNSNKSSSNNNEKTISTIPDDKKLNDKSINNSDKTISDDKKLNDKSINKNDKTKENIDYKNIINMSLFVFIGFVVIMLCDQITELAINIGMKRTMTLLEPLLEELIKLKKS